MRLRPVDYYNLTWREYVLTVRGFDKNRSREYEHTRAICFYIMSFGFKEPRKKPASMQEMWPLPTDPKIDMDAESKKLKAIMAQANEQFKEFEKWQMRTSK